ncbi:hypothetical protein IXB50_11640 [Leptothoe spongobia TAU-MAC 1115]|uniref:Peroxidase n=2 Tax=Leptothoe TaxID=2651725 RepID=A0A947DFC5_9CYAN|nr:hypothetical protein [Leptothoe spongobia TAU-MAC 1115]
MTKARGCGHTAVSSFSKLFPDLPGVVVSEADAAILGGPGGLMHDFDGTSNDCDIPAGYIFFAQFVDHDITLDTTSGLREDPKSPGEISELPNIRSASLDLDCVYGFGPEGSPHIYDGVRPGRLAINPNGYDLARSPSGTALIGDPRNDENIFVSQMQLLFHRFHNKIYNERVYQENKSESFNRFEEAQKQTRYHYQWLVLFDFLKRLCDPEVYKFAANLLLSNQPNQAPKYPLCYRPDDHGKLSMPVEFSVAAYRVGHTLVRSTYAANGNNLDIELFDERFGTLGFSAFPEELEVDWRYLLEVDDCIHPRMSKAVDPLLADEIQNLPVVGSNNPNNRALAFRNLLRGNVMSLPSGQAVADKLRGLGYPIPHNDLQLGDLPSALQGNTPLFYYILQESKINNAGQRLGPVGSAILMEVFGGMLTHCDSFLKEDNWNPDPCLSREKSRLAPDKYKEGFLRKPLVERENYYPFDLADVVRFVQSDS